MKCLVRQLAPEQQGPLHERLEHLPDPLAGGIVDQVAVLVELLLRIANHHLGPGERGHVEKHQHLPEVVLSDIGLPVESGYDLIQKIRALPSHFSKIPAVALTAFATEKDRQRALALGFQMHLAKPVEASALIQAIEQLVNGEHDQSTL